MTKILVCGDSFSCTDASNGKSWVDLLAKNNRLVNLSAPGIGEYKILQQIQSADLNEFDVTIISHTSPYRVHALVNPLYPTGHRHHTSDILFSDVESKLPQSQFLYEYFTQIMDPVYYEYVHTKICSDIDRLTANFKVIHITHFDWTNLHQFENNTFVNFHNLWVKNKGAYNHYSESGNKLIYSEIAKIL